MPTTILDGETLEQAYARRFREEAEIDARATCKHEYITTYVDADGEPGGLWGCRDCKARFAPLADQIEAEKQRDLLADALRIIARNVFMYHEETIETIALDALAKVQP